MFYKVVANIEWVDTGPLSQGKYKVSFLLAFGHSILNNWSIYYFVLCVFLLKETTFNIYWFINIELTTNSTMSYLNETLTHVFSP